MSHVSEKAIWIPQRFKNLALSERRASGNKTVVRR
jgi:hypothetical protein